MMADLARQAYKPKSQRCWALYKGDDLVATGTIREIAKQTGKSIDFLSYMTSPTYDRRVARRTKLAAEKGRVANLQTMTDIDDEEVGSND